MDDNTKFTRLRKNRNLLCGFLILGIIIGLAISIYFFVDPAGNLFNAQIVLKYLKRYFQILFLNGDDKSAFAIIGLFLLIFPGTCALAVTFLMVRRSFEFLGYILSFVVAIIYIFLGVAILIIFPAIALPIVFFVIAAIILFLGVRGFIYKNDSFIFFDVSRYSIPTTSDSLVVYFQGRGYAKKIAYAEASKEGAEIFEMVPSYYSCGKIKNKASFFRKYSKKQYGMSFNLTYNKDFEKYKKVIVVSPVSNGHLSPLTRYFFREYGRKVSPDLTVDLVGRGRPNLLTIYIEIECLTELKDFKMFFTNTDLNSRKKTPYLLATKTK